MLDQINAVINSAAGQSAMIAMVLDLVLRLIPSEKPLSIARALAAGARGLGKALTGLADLMDKVLPQNIKK